MNDLLNQQSQTFALTNVNILKFGALEFPTIDCKKVRTFLIKDAILLDLVFTAFLREFTSLENLEFSNLQIIRSQQLEEKIICSFVKSIDFSFTSWEVFDYFLTPTISLLRLTSPNLHAHPSIVTFLSKTQSLKKLEIHAVACDIMEFFGQSDYTFTLKNLSLITSGYLGPANINYEDNFLDFIKEHTSSLNTLEMKAMMLPGCLDYLTKKLRSLRWLSLKVNYLIQNPSLYFNKKTKKSVKSLILEGPFNGTEMILAILMLYSSVKQLTFRDLHVNMSLDFIGEVLVKAVPICTELQELNVLRMPTLNPKLIFSKLEILRVSYVNDWNDLKVFLASNKTINILHIEYIFRLQSSLQSMEMILASNIKELHIKADACEIKRIYEFMEVTGSGHLKLLELIIRSHDTKSYFFHFNTDYANSHVIFDLYNDIHAIMIDDIVEYLENESEDLNDNELPNALN